MSYPKPASGIPSDPGTLWQEVFLQTEDSSPTVKSARKTPVKHDWRKAIVYHVHPTTPVVKEEFGETCLLTGDCRLRSSPYGGVGSSLNVYSTEENAFKGIRTAALDMANKLTREAKGLRDKAAKAEARAALLSSGSIEDLRKAVAPARRGR